MQMCIPVQCRQIRCVLHFSPTLLKTFTHSPVGGAEETAGGVGEVKPSAGGWAPAAASGVVEEEGAAAGV